MQKQLYILAGCNGAGKTTASQTILPEIWQCKEFVNADAIACGLSPFDPESVAFQAGRLMLQRIDELMAEGVSFSIETTLATRSYVDLVNKAQTQGYWVNLLFFWINSPEMAIQRVAKRVAEGGHNIPEDVIRRRYDRGIKNFFELFKDQVDFWTLVDNTKNPRVVVADSNQIYDNKQFLNIQAYVKRGTAEV